MLLSSCNGASPSPPKPCDATCADSTALLAMRLTLKVMFNLTVQGNSVGMQDATKACPLGGTAHVFGTATSNAVQGATNVDLTYVLDHCGYIQIDPDPTQNFQMAFTGTVKETGTLSATSTSTTAIELSSDALTFSGTVYDPAVDYEQDGCALALGQSGNRLAGMMCGRVAGTQL
jgi:hypothetical protein